MQKIKLLRQHNKTKKYHTASQQTIRKSISFACKTPSNSSAMQKKEEKNSIIEFCPVRNVIARFGDKWSFLVLLTINEHQVVRFNELCRAIPDISPRMLSGTLRTLEANGLISRKAYPVVPPKVEYRLTDIGNSLIPHINQLTEWALANMQRLFRTASNSTNRNNIIHPQIH